MGKVAEMKQLTGYHVLAVTLSFFGVIIAVNGLLAYKAVYTFPGLEVANSYVASQTFDAEREAQAALGWTLTPSYQAGKLSLRFTDRAGLPVQVVSLAVLAGRSTSAADDSHPEFTPVLDGYAAAITLKPGKWMLQVEARSVEGTLFRQRLDFNVKG